MDILLVVKGLEPFDLTMAALEDAGFVWFVHTLSNRARGYRALSYRALSYHVSICHAPGLCGSTPLGHGVGTVRTTLLSLRGTNLPVVLFCHAKIGKKKR